MIRPEHVRMARAGLDLTLQALAQEAEVNPNTISRYESGRDVLAGSLRKVQDALQRLGTRFVEGDGEIGVHLTRNPSKRVQKGRP